MANIIKEYGFPVISADELAHQAMEPGTAVFEAIIKEFGDTVVGGDGRINRRELGRRVFKDAALRRKLEKIVHPSVIAEIRRARERFQNSGEPFLIVEAPLLFEAGMADLFDFIWVVAVSAPEQQKRLRARDRLSETEVQERIAAQQPLKEKIMKADAVIDNNISIEETRRQLVKLLNDLGVANC